MNTGELNLDREMLCVYFAGKINQPEGVEDWRLRMRDGEPEGMYCTLGQNKYRYIGPNYVASPTSSDEINEHKTEYTKHDKRMQTRAECLETIRLADIVVGFVQTGCYGTMYELGYARALGKLVFERIEDEECWFASNMADYIEFPESVESLRSDLENELNVHRIARSLYLRRESPLEGQFIKDIVADWPAIVAELEAQAQVGKYRLDFAHKKTKVAIELDGYTYHGRDAAFRHDRERDRWLSAQGWTVLRFHGDEVRENGRKIVGEVRSMIWKRQRDIEINNPVEIGNPFS